MGRFLTLLFFFWIAVFLPTAEAAPYPVYCANDGAHALTFPSPGNSYVCSSVTGGAATNLPLSGLESATTANSFDNANYAQTWTWNSLTTGTGLALSTTDLSSGNLFSISVTSTANTGNALYAKNASTNGGYAGYFSGAVDITGALTAGSITGPLTSSSVFGVAEVDNSTITASSGVITAANTTVNSVTCTPGGSCTVGSALSGLTASTTAHTFDNANYAQTWTWNSLTTGTGLVLSTTDLSSGNLVSLSVTSTANTGNTLYVNNSSTAGGYAADFNGNVAITNGLQFTSTCSSATNPQICSPVATALGLATSGNANELVAVTSGYIGINTSTPAGPLDVYLAGNEMFRVVPPSGTYTSNSWVEVRPGGSSGGPLVGTSAGNVTFFGPSGGDVLIGTGGGANSVYIPVNSSYGTSGNSIELQASSSGVAPSVTIHAGSGGDTNQNLNLTPLGTGNLNLTSGKYELAGSQIAYSNLAGAPTSGDVMISAGSSNPTGVAEVDGDCLLGSGGSWTAGSCSGGGGSVSIAATTTATELFPLMASSTGSASTIYIDQGSPWEYQPSTGTINAIAITTTGDIISREYANSSGTSVTINFTHGNSQKFEYTTGSAITLTTTGGVAGQNLTLVSCNESGGTSSGITWAGGDGTLEYSGGSQPGSTTTNGYCDTWFWHVTYVNSTLIYNLTGMTPDWAD